YFSSSIALGPLATTVTSPTTSSRYLARSSDVLAACWRLRAPLSRRNCPRAERSVYPVTIVMGSSAIAAITTASFTDQGQSRQRVMRLRLPRRVGVRRAEAHQVERVVRHEAARVFVRQAPDALAEHRDPHGSVERRDREIHGENVLRAVVRGRARRWIADHASPREHGVEIRIRIAHDLHRTTRAESCRHGVGIGALAAAQDEQIERMV